jgi:hypothetical protein
MFGPSWLPASLGILSITKRPAAEEQFRLSFLLCYQLQMMVCSI